MDFRSSGDPTVLNLSEIDHQPVSFDAFNSIRKIYLKETRSGIDCRCAVPDDPIARYDAIEIKSGPDAVQSSNFSNRQPMVQRWLEPLVARIHCKLFLI